MASSAHTNISEPLATPVPVKIPWVPLIWFAVLLFLPFYKVIAVMVELTFEMTGAVLMINLTIFDPAGMVMEAGTLAAGLELDRLTTRPPAGAGPVR